MKHNYLKVAALALALAGANQIAAQITTTYDYTGDVQTYTVPPGITSIRIECWGAQGQATTVDDYAPFSTGGLGGYAIGELAVTPGEVLNVYVGGQGADGAGGYNGGATGGFGTAGTGGTAGYAGSGGGGSDVRQGGTDLADRVIVAGGGGGGGRNYTNGTCVPCGTGGNGGDGGGIVGGDGDDPDDPIYGTYFNPGSGAGGGTDIAGGAGGDGPEGPDGNPGVLGAGGLGINGNYGIASGGGGGGYYGGGSGAGASSGSGDAGGGGGGGSSYVGGVVDGETIAGERTGHGQIIITELCTPLTVDISSTEICSGTELTLTADSELGGTVVWDDGDVPNGEAFVPGGLGEVTFTATSDEPTDCPYTATVTILELPEVTAEVDDIDICFGDSVIFTASGTADFYEWSGDIVSGEYYTPETTGDNEFKLFGTDETTGCSDSSTVFVFVYELPEVVATSDEDSYCDGDMITLTGEGADTYEWDMGVEDGVAFSQEIGTEVYTVTGTSLDGCIESDEIEITVNPNPEISLTGTDELFGSDGTIDLTVDAGAAPFTFDWDNDGTGDFDDDEDLADLGAGTYTVVVMDANGCTVTDEITLNSQVGIEGIEAQLLTVYPNPTVADLTIVREGSFTYQLITISGEVVLNGVANDQEILNMSEMANGVYLLQVNANNALQTIKVVKQ
ncbi:MAG: T9SS type A sorting domain-containing protein [Crocinitomicaceae bacterium]